MEGAEALLHEHQRRGLRALVAHELGRDLGCGALFEQAEANPAGAFTLAEAHTLEKLDPLAGNLEALEELACIPPPAAGDAAGDGRPDGPGKASQRRTGQSARVLASTAGEGLCRAAGAAGDCHARGRDALSAGGCDGVRMYACPRAIAFQNKAEPCGTVHSRKTFLGTRLVSEHDFKGCGKPRSGGK